MVGCSLDMVYKARKKHMPKAPQSSKAPSLHLPKLDPAQPAAPQLESMAWAVVGASALGQDVTGRQLQAAKEIIKQAKADKAPPPVDRRIVFKLDEIDLEGDDFKIISSRSYEIKAP